MNSDAAIEARDLSKVYRLYARERYRLLDILGVLPRGAAYREHKALDSVSIAIQRGEKVAIIGRNGAGKSTFMKLVSRVIEPTRGSLVVNAKVHALLQIGTGFHPDFTGRQNVLAYLAQTGVSRQNAERLYGEIVEFAELEEYIDQPVKTYSTGMGVRLMFATSTAIEPDLLLLDEVLGVGDAYFAQKSFDRIRQMCTSGKSTLLLVTHDVYSAARLCERMIWIDRGRVVVDDAAAVVIRAYEDSIRVQEEHRLRRRRLSASVAAPDREHGATPLLVEIAALQNVPQPSPLYLSDISVLRGDRVVASLPLSGAQTGDSTLERDGVAWGDAVQWQGTPSRAMLNYGSPFHRVAGVLSIPAADADAGSGMQLRVRYWSDEPCRVQLRAFADGWAADFGQLPPVAGAWREHVVAFDPGAAPERTFVPVPNVSAAFGTADIHILSAAFVDDNGAALDVLRHGEPATLQLAYEVRNPDLRERAQVVVVFHRDGLQDVCRVIARNLTFAAARTAGTVRLTIPRLELTDGTYTLTVMIAEEGYYDRPQTTFFAIHAGVYSCLSRAFDVRVIGTGFIGAGTISVTDGAWSLS